MKQVSLSIGLLACLLLSLTAVAQPPEQLVKIVVAPDHPDWLYKTGEKVKFMVTVLQAGNPIAGVKIRYELGPEKMKPLVIDSATLADGKKLIEGGSLSVPGFLRCIVTANVNGKTYRNLATAGFSPTAIQPTVAMPADFNQFWNKVKEDLAKVPVDAKLLLLPERCTETVNVYQVNMQNIGNARLYGILCVPKKDGKYPALLKVPGAGVRAYRGDVATAEKGIITLEIGIHGIPVIMDDNVYASLAAGALNGYPNIGLDNKDRFYYKRVYAGCIRANDFLSSLPQYDGKNLGVCGGSQGGALSIVTASLDDRVKYLSALYPALSDVTGYLNGRAGGWPHYFDNNNLQYNNKPDKLNTVGYFDVVNFARQLKVEGFYAWGFNDEVCPPTSTYAAYNAIKAPKQLYLALETGHWTFPEENEKFITWITDKLLAK
ncbi:MAG TPA: acetylxylan esterase [Chitinophagaceae bacterium]|nr:acetylxylan esterase [Chitinophagaceae bacterium]